MKRLVLPCRPQTGAQKGTRRLFIQMTQLAIISTIIGIIAGAISIIEKAFGIFGGKKPGFNEDIHLNPVRAGIVDKSEAYDWFYWSQKGA